MLVKSYVTMHNGSISCVSQENAGSTFRVVIPYKEKREQETFVTSENQKQVDIPGDDATPRHQSKKSAQRSDTHILIVEDNDDLRKFMQSSISEEFEVSTAEDGVVAWDFINKQMPDLVISDVVMPNMDGFELCRFIKSTFETAHIPVILLTALSKKSEQLHGLGLGADDYLTKPFDMNILQQRIKSIIKNREILSEKALKLLKLNNDDSLLTNELNDAFVKVAIQAVRTQISNPDFDKVEFASALNISSSLLYKKIKAFTNLSPVDFIKLIRMNYAMELLQTRKYSITRISELCGFNSIHYFSLVFKRHFGKQPSDFF
jgi:DNA-binding response OmpR family regulator